MKSSLLALAMAMLAGTILSSSPTWAQQKTVKACVEEWRANKAANQANGVTEKAYVAQCRTGGAAAQSPAPAAQTPAATPTAGSAAPSQGVAGQKTVKVCVEEWRANKAANQASGVTEKAYVAQCRTGSAAAQSPAPAAQTPAAVPSTSTAGPAAPSQKVAGQKTVKVCVEEWRANKAANQASGTTEKAYVAQCRTGGAAAQSPAPAAQTPAATPSTPTGPAPSTATRSAPPVANSAAPAGLNQFSTATDAKRQCPSDTIIWVNLNSKIYHYAGHKAYGATKNGAYMCERDTAAQGMRASRNEKRPGA